MAHRIPGNRSACRDCNRTILWVTMNYAKPRSLDLEPSAYGDVALIRTVELRGRKTVLAVRLDESQLDAFRAAGGELYRFHYATCTARRPWDND